jgi:hypothetical protein
MAVADVTQTTAASQPLLLAHSGVSSDNYYFQSGVSGNFITSPSATANQITGTVDFDYSFIVQANNSTIFGKIATNASTPSYAVFISTNLVYYIDSLGNYNIIVNIGSFLPAVGSLFYIRVTLVGTTATCFTSLDGISWTSRATATVAPLVTSNSSTLTFTSGSAATNPQKAYRMRIYNGLRDSGGTLVADCNPATYNAAASQTAWTSSTGEVWTINTGTAANTLRGVLVDRTKTQGLGTISNYCLTSNLNRPSISTSFVAGLFYDSQISYPIYGPSTANLSYAIAYYTNGVRFMTDNSNGAAQISESLNKLFVMTFLNKSGGSNASINNGTIYNVTSSDTGATSTGTGILKGNQIFNTLITSGTESTTLQKTAVYNLIKIMNLI